MEINHLQIYLLMKNFKLNSELHHHVVLFIRVSISPNEHNIT